MTTFSHKLDVFQLFHFSHSNSISVRFGPFGNPTGTTFSAHLCQYDQQQPQ
ncbi:hypothetical protein [Anaerolinea thermolimosa]|uniref:hypothetical protein n=1 Tax=Anaerolinea thermolimosa TaxID=229919 RepID=UPI0013B3E149|nr:hypothetical protein [Anaerolinea thermolimosa]